MSTLLTRDTLRSSRYGPGRRDRIPSMAVLRLCLCDSSDNPLVLYQITYFGFSVT